MHSGRLPKVDHILPVPDPQGDVRAARTRRRFLLAICAGAAFGTGAWWLGRGSTARHGERQAAPPRGTLAWALWLRTAPVDEALAAAGDFERVAARHPREQSLVPVSCRILDLALASDAEFADAAAACALRTLEIQQALDVVRAKASAVVARRDLERANRELQYLTAPRRSQR